MTASVAIDADAEMTAAPGDWRNGAARKSAGHDVVVRLSVLGRRADVEPVAVRDVRDERLPVADERREIVALDRGRRAERNPVQ